MPHNLFCVTAPMLARVKREPRGWQSSVDGKPPLIRLPEGQSCNRQQRPSCTPCTARPGCFRDWQKTIPIHEAIKIKLSVNFPKVIASDVVTSAVRATNPTVCHLVQKKPESDCLVGGSVGHCVRKQWEDAAYLPPGNRPVSVSSL